MRSPMALICLLFAAAWAPPARAVSVDCDVVALVQSLRSAAGDTGIPPDRQTLAAMIDADDHGRAVRELVDVLPAYKMEQAMTWLLELERPAADWPPAPPALRDLWCVEPEITAGTAGPGMGTRGGGHGDGSQDQEDEEEPRSTGVGAVMSAVGGGSWFAGIIAGIIGVTGLIISRLKILDMRSLQRSGCAYPVEVTSDDGLKKKGTIKDISATGCRMKLTGKTRRGDAINLMIEGVDRPALVVWRRPRRAGIKFDEPLAKAEMDAVLGHGRTA